MAEPDDLNGALDAYLAAMSVQCAGLAKFFRPPAPPEDLAALEAALGAAVPVQLSWLLARHDGSDIVMVVPGYMLLSARAVAFEWKAWEELRVWLFDPDGISCSPEGPIQGDRWWRSGWIPFASDGTGDFLCIDTDPASGGTEGQIITMRHDDERRTVVAPSLDRWFLELATHARQGRVLWDPALYMAAWREDSAP